MSHGRRAAVLTLGCKVNQFESSAMSESLRRAGYEVLDQALGVDLVVLNTCTVTGKADSQALALLRRLKRLNPQATIVATGCLAQANPQTLTEAGLADLVLGQNEKACLTEYLDPQGRPKEGTYVQVSPLQGPVADFGAPSPERTRAFYKIQDGCSAFCAYCAVPLARGPSRSLALETVLEALRSYLERGLKEVVLCGVHLGRWGRDLEPALSLAELLHTIGSELELDAERFRLRLSSLEPLELDDEILAAYELYPWLAPHFHLPLQSGSNRILKLMGRPYTAEQFRSRVEAISRRWPLAALGVDIMAGFPQETEADFQASFELLAELPLSYFHVFPYARRPGTRAAADPQQVPEHIKRGRVLKLKALNQAKRAAFAAANFGSQQLALVENSPHRPSGRLKILSGNYLSALLPADLESPAAGDLLWVCLKEPANPWGFLEAHPFMAAL